MENETKNQAENINNDDEKLLLSDVIRRSPYEIELENQIKLLEEIKQKLLKKIKGE